MNTLIRILPPGTRLALGVLALALTACQAPEPQESAAGDEADAAESTSMESANGEWVTLFDGNSLDAWRGFRADSVPSAWVIDQGAIHFNPDANEGGDLITRETFDDFILELEWKIGECGNSGIMFNVVDNGEYNNTYDTGPEMQVLDNTCHPDAENGQDRWAGANYALHAPSVDASNPAGEWNSVRLVVDGNHVEHWLNGEKIVEYEMHSDDWQTRVDASKFTDFPGYATAESGHIAIQDHDDPVWFRNIRIQRL